MATSLGVEPIWLRCNPNTGAVVAPDEFANNSFTINGAPELHVAGGLKGSPNKAIKLKAKGDYLSCIDNPDLDFGDKWSFAWVLRRDATGGFEVLTEKAAGAPFIRFIENNKLEVRKSGTGKIAESTTALTDTASFHLVVVTKDGAALKIWIDGADVTGTINNQTTTNTAERLIFGEDNESAVSNTTFDEILAFKGAVITKAQVEALYAAMGSEAGGKEELKELEEAEALRKKQEAEHAELWPLANWRPFASKAPANTRLGPSPTLHKDSATVISKLIAGASSDVPAVLEVRDNGSGGEPTFYMRSTDTQRTIELTDEEKYGGAGEVKGAKVKLPNAARPEGLKAWDGNLEHDYDAHIDIVDQAGNRAIGLWRLQHSPIGAVTTIKAQYGGIAKLDDEGIDYSGDATASHHSNVLGRIRIEQLLAGKINQALAVTMPKAAGIEKYIGARFWLEMSVSEINALAIPAWKKTIYRAMALYGLFFIDYGGGALMTLQTETGSQYVDCGIYDPWLEWAEARAAANEDFAHFGGDESFPPTYEGSFEGDGIDWANKLKLLDAEQPPVSGLTYEEVDAEYASYAAIVATSMSYGELLDA